MTNIQQIPHRAFTSKYPGKARELINKVNLIDKNGNSIREVIALWDTGATSSVIRANLALEMKLPVISYAEQSTANGKCSVPIYIVGIQLPNNLQFQIPVSGSNISDDIDMLIGMDLIGLGDFTISNSNGKTVLSFVVPSLRETDYVAEIDDINKRAYKGVGRNEPCPCGSGKKYKNCHGK